MNNPEPVPAALIGLAAAALSGGIVGATIAAVVTLAAMRYF